MKVALISLIFLVLFFQFTIIYSFEPIDPKIINYMDAELTQSLFGSFYGTINKGDKLEVSVLRPVKSESLSWEIIEEYLEIQGKRFYPKVTNVGDLEYSTFELSDLFEYVDEPKFTIVRKMHVQSKSRVGIVGDYNLVKEFSDYKDYVQASENMESNDFELKAFASQFKSSSFLETISLTSEWVHNNIVYDLDNYYKITATAKETFKSKRGVCDEFANLTGALLRANGVPVRYVSGISFDGETFGNHGWIETYSPSTGWLPVDSTFAEVGYVDAAHIPFSKTKDINESVDIITKTKSMKPIEVDVFFGEPKVEIKKIGLFQKNTSTALLVPEKALPNKPIVIKVQLQNLTENSLIVPLNVFAHKDFKSSEKTKLFVLNGKESALKVWNLITPNKEVVDKEYTYEILAISFDSNDKKQITISNIGEAGVGEAKVTELVPEVIDSKIILSLNFENFSGSVQKFKVSAIHDNQVVVEKEFEVKDTLAKEKLEVPLVVGVLIVKVFGVKDQEFHLEFVDKKHETQKEVKRSESEPINSQVSLAENKSNDPVLDFFQSFNWVGFAQIALLVLIVIFSLGLVLTKRI
ncbi:MAG: transglutaminase-like domain-containing protein [Candidatus Diapherotrites archaeon]